jgi:Ran GTPase-activating protein (RanGAP) involved in mRNA processing and transport
VRLRRPTGMQQVNLHRMPSQPAKEILKRLKEAAESGSSDLDLSPLTLGYPIGPEGGSLVAEFAKAGRLQSVTTLELGEAGIGEDAFEQILLGLDRHPGLRELGLARNGLGERSMESLATASARGGLSALERLDLRRNRVDAKGADLLGRAAANLPALTQLDLRWGNPIGIRGARALAHWADIGHFRTLGFLSLAENGVGAEGVSALIDSARSMISLVGLTVSKEGLGDAGAELLAKRAANLRGLRSIDLSENGIGDPGGKALARAFHEWKSLEWIGLARNRIGDAGAAGIAASLDGLQHLLRLDLDYNDFGDPAAEAFAAAARKGSLRQVERLRLYTSRMTRDGVRTLSEALDARRCPALRELHTAIDQVERDISLIVPLADQGRAGGPRWRSRAQRMVETAVRSALAEAKGDVSTRGVLAVTGFTLSLTSRDGAPNSERAGDQLREEVARFLRQGGGEAAIELDNLTLALRVFPNRARAEGWITARHAQLGAGRRAESAVPETPASGKLDVASVLRSLDAPLPDEYEARRRVLCTLTDAVREQVRRAMEPALNQRAAALPQGTYDEKKELAKWVNGELRRFGLAIRCKGKRCFLMGNPGGQPGIGRFVLEYTDDQGKRHHPLTSVTLPHLELMLDDLERTAFGERVSRMR